MSLSKKTRYGIFARDQFTCRYCGASPPDVKLWVDHVHPLSKGGTDDPENLVTSCESCNRGKAASVPKPGASTEQDGRCRVQEMMETIELADLAARTAAAREQIREVIQAEWQRITGNDRMNRRSISTIARLLDEFEPRQVFEWLDRACEMTPNEVAAMKYLSGCARNTRGATNGQVQEG